MAKKITTPLTEAVARSLKMGEETLITGVILTGRDVAHKRLCESMDKDGKAPIDLEGQIIYYVGPSPAKPGKAVGSAGPTTSYRMDAYSPQLIRQAGLKGMIGKGPRNQQVKDAMKEKGCVYFAATGGAAALIARAIKKSTTVLYDELDAEAVRKYDVEDFPVVVATDCQGNDLYEEGPKKYRKG
ncbi:Fe-S-containing hydro-lyase [candidate division TA06 bacterium]|uniref:Fe-S-containing hydro-lyase n=1 Tax=candidate division TA06 bacterium TaxID=2250710 RepID=A0A933I8X2_UNCT6|nr:Fe-S-containing hydro-lyase [candidate division TA06 bacterium]